MRSLFTICVLCICLLFGCSKNDDSRGLETFDLINVADASINVPLNPLFSWETVPASNGGTITYDLYLDTSEQPTTIVGNDLAETSFQIVVPLQLVTQYFWKVIAKDTKGNIISSVVFSFATRALDIPSTPITQNAPFSERTGHTSVTFMDQMWVVGGFDGDLKSDVWKSTDGNQWTLVTATAAFEEINGHTMLVYNDKMYIIGGFRCIPSSGCELERRKEVWSSSDGLTWIEETNDAAFSARNLLGSVVYNNKMWILGGIDDSGRTNDVWNSTDGINWTVATIAANFSPRVSPRVVAFDDKMWVIGGSDGAPQDDVWYSEDGSSWTQATASLGTGGRSGHSATVYKNNIWVMGGSDTSSERYNDIWHSSDGSHWVEMDTPASFPERSGHSTIVLDAKLWIIAGTGGPPDYTKYNDVWALD